MEETSRNRNFYMCDKHSPTNRDISLDSLPPSHTYTSRHCDHATSILKSSSEWQGQAKTFWEWNVREAQTQAQNKNPTPMTGR